MPSSLFPNQNNQLLDAIKQMKSLASGNPQALFENMLRTNPQFKSFAESVKRKTPEEAFNAYGLDFQKVRELLK